ncbi:GntR family transcriptional regulator [Bacillus sp. DTU_2020_1000418_1_SI_GHA_SEK_038]|nr:GntR family transcriptional regulator [Bacillus sp. DTU_2020_1000418_1_SI_GHA_SEK_038]WNS74569.1 GntR family transcriptional regulator [Bacillus sp. DTU_2020_1000418_1_SI_GHA_SEK_038]
MDLGKQDSKIYVEIVKQLRLMIEQEGLKAGDKLPSERELCERLLVGRSSVREALRALELLGLIETRRGEGTFIRDFKGHQLVQLISTFILQDEKAKADIAETKFLIEMDCLSLVLVKSRDKLQDLKKWAETSSFTDEDFFLKIVHLADNHLLLRIWTILKDYYNSLKIFKMEADKQEYMNVVDKLLIRKESEVRKAYKELRKLSND